MKFLTPHITYLLTQLEETRRNLQALLRYLLFLVPGPRHRGVPGPQHPVLIAVGSRDQRERFAEAFGA